MLDERKSKAATTATTAMAATPDRGAVTTGLLTAAIAEPGAASG